EHLDAEGFERAGLLVRLHQPEAGFAGAVIDPRVRIQRDHPERRAELAGRARGQRDHPLVAAMHAVEAAYGHGGAAVALAQVLPSADDAKPPSHQSRRGTMIRASPSITVLPPTRQTVSSVAWPLAASSALTVTLATTGSPIRTGRRKRSDWE